MRTFDHIGIPTTEPQPNEEYIDQFKLHLTDFRNSINQVEYLRFDEGSCMPELVRTKIHMAYYVPDMEAALAGAKVVLAPFPSGDHLCAFIEEDGIAIELMQKLAN